MKYVLLLLLLVGCSGEVFTHTGDAIVHDTPDMNVDFREVRIIDGRPDVLEVHAEDEVHLRVINQDNETYAFILGSQVEQLPSQGVIELTAEQGTYDYGVRENRVKGSLSVI